MKLICFLLLSTPALLFAQGSAGSNATQEARYLFNLPTAGTLKRGTFAIEGWFYAGGGAMIGASVGISDRFSLGLSYGAGNLIGSGSPSWNRLPGAMVRYRILDEELTLPALTVGFESQGRGRFIDSLSRYERKSPGFFLAASKNFEFLGYLTLHSGLNYSILEASDDGNANFYIGLEKTIGTDFTFYVQYDFALNDDRSETFGRGSGFLDIGLRWSLGAGFTLEFNLSNLNNNFRSLSALDRSVRLEFIQAF
ncbi:MAG: hypothetical protein RMI34_09660 [Chloroherpetonaceae bacterium]|nr:YjbH domain-containing protein [Chloroherpetonaceae bacterium]MCS7211177.1 YjbH domain-containing protein [Chloroherpetonaceae bacterium]MDW8020324.1 hypothetical protein [Chloroherpetonaceae bacterium]